MSARRRIQAACVCVVLLGVAAFAIGTAPTSDDLTSPFYVSGPANEPVTSRALSVEVQGARLAKSLDVSGSNSLRFSLDVLETEQTWIIIDALVETRVNNVSLSNTQLRIGDVEYRATDFLPAPTLVEFIGDPGIPVAGSFAFEVPTEILSVDDAAHAQLVMRSILSSQLDEIAVVDVDLSGLEVRDIEVVRFSEIAEAR